MPKASELDRIACAVAEKKCVDLQSELATCKETLAQLAAVHESCLAEMRAMTAAAGVLNFAHEM